ncbi:MAG: DUF4249 domain-containing protein [Bacteroidales bacterium]|nr:DUF4249 domain-containing protein [Bacteroidales bacterium]
MKNIIKNIFSFVVLVLFAASCEKVLTDQQVDRPNDLAVVNCVAGDTDSLWVHVTSTRFSLESAQINVLQDAQVSLLLEGTLLANLAYQPNHGAYYAQDIKLIPGNIYQVTVTTGQFGQQRGNLTIPNLPSFTVDNQVAREKSQEFYYYVRDEKIDSAWLFRANVTINDPPGEKNYYIINIQNAQQAAQHYDSVDHVPVDYYYSGYSGFQYEFPFTLVEINDYGFYVSSDWSSAPAIAITDEFLDGEKIKVKCYNSVLGLPASEDSVVALNINVQAISEDYYKYVFSYAKYYEAVDIPIAEKVHVHSNVENGLGILAGYAQATSAVSLKLPELYLKTGKE